jgi:hypothetical protein
VSLAKVRLAEGGKILQNIAGAKKSIIYTHPLPENQNIYQFFERS